MHFWTKVTVMRNEPYSMFGIIFARLQISPVVDFFLRGEGNRLNNLESC